MSGQEPYRVHRINITWGGSKYASFDCVGGRLGRRAVDEFGFALRKCRPIRPIRMRPYLKRQICRPMASPSISRTPKRLPLRQSRNRRNANWNTMCIAVVDTHGELVYFEKQDNCAYASTAISQHKARAAARYRRPTLVFERLYRQGALLRLSVDARRRDRFARRQSADGRRQSGRRHWRERRHRRAG